MRTLAFDGRMGASGDMLLGALLAAGADRGALDPVEAALDVQYEISRTTRAGIAATAVDVRLVVEDADADQHDDSEGEPDHEHDRGPDHEHGHGHEEHDGHEHEDGRGHDHSHDTADGSHAEGHGPHRSYPAVRKILGDIGLPQTVETRAGAIFERLGKAEAAVHGTDLGSIHFHEVGADDAIADVVGVCLLLADLDVDRIVTTPLRGGSGEVSMAHGTYPVPAPAVVELASEADWELQGGPLETELLTPTGAAILAEIAEGVRRLPALDVSASGYGAGSNAFEEYPNVLRALVGDGKSGLRSEEVTVLETNIDDATPEVLGSLQESLSAAGARDVTILPATMKKSRPGHLVKVICHPVDAEALAERVVQETGTLGIREHGAGHRWVADRHLETVSVAVDGDRYDVDVKVAMDRDGERYDVSAEYDDIQTVASETGLPLREVRQRAEARLFEESAAGE